MQTIILLECKYFIGFHTFSILGEPKVSDMKEYDLIVIGTGSAMGIINATIQKNPHMKVAVIDKDEPGGICLTRGCIPSKILLYSAELVKTIERAGEFGIDIEIKKIA